MTYCGMLDLFDLGAIGPGNGPGLMDSVCAQDLSDVEATRDKEHRTLTGLSGFNTKNTQWQNWQYTG